MPNSKKKREREGYTVCTECGRRYAGKVMDCQVCGPDAEVVYYPSERARRSRYG